MVGVCVSAHDMVNTQIIVMSPLVLKGTYRVCNNIWYHPDDLFYRDVPAYAIMAMQSHILPTLLKRGFWTKTVQVINWSDGNPYLSPITMYFVTKDTSDC